MYAVQTADSADLAELRDGARDGVAAARARRRQMSQGKQALTAGAGQTAAADGAGAPPVAETLHVNGAGAPPTASNGHGVPSGAGVATDGVAAAHLGRALSKERRRQLSQGNQALTAGAGQTAATAGVSAPAAASNGQGAPSGAKRAPSGAGIATDGVAAAHLGRTLSKERRRQLSQGKQALTAGAGQTAAAAGVGAPPAADGTHLNGAVSGPEQARARRAEASRFGSAGTSRPQREGRVTRPAKVVVSPTHGGQRVTGPGIGPGVRVTGDEAGAALPVSGSQYVPADGSSPAPGAGQKVGLVRTVQGLVVSGTTVRNKVAITGDEAGEHLPITGEADQKFEDDLTPRSDGAYRSAQFPRRADPHGASAVGTRLAQPGMAASDGEGPWHPLETTVDGMPVTGTAVGRSGRVTGNEAGACRPITGAQYQNFSSTECGGIGGGTAPAAHLNQARLDPATGGKVSVARTWGGQSVTGPSVEYRPNVTGDEPGFCHQVTGTPYHGPSTTFGWCEPDEGELATQRLKSRPEGVAVTGDVPMHAEAVTGTERGHGRAVTGTSYYGDMRPAEPAADDWTGGQAFPVAWARRLAGGESDAATQESRAAAPPASSVPGSITGSFAIADDKVTGTKEFMFRPRSNRDAKQPAVTGEGRTEGRTITGSPAAWTSHDRVTGTEGYIAAGRNPSEGGGTPHAWAGALKFQALATPGGPRQTQNVTGLSGWSAKAAARVTLSGGAQG
ncbi:MAG TPA: CsoS2 family carboxysome shell protein [Acidimicrobiales bacterium]|nr:CsoS2 family carboxysome shell protein [Acidimicrobiales bacterium]